MSKAAKWLMLAGIGAVWIFQWFLERDEQTRSDAMNKESLLTDVRYALRQLREFRDIGRAVDALERVESALHSQEEDAGGEEEAD